MEILKEYAEKFGVKEVVNDYGEHRQTRERSIVFPNGLDASIVKNNGVDVWHPKESTQKNLSQTRNTLLQCAITMDVLIGKFLISMEQSRDAFIVMTNLKY